MQNSFCLSVQFNKLIFFIREWKFFMGEWSVDKLGVLLKKKVFIDPVSWNLKSSNTQIISKRKFLYFPLFSSLDRKWSGPK